MNGYDTSNGVLYQNDRLFYKAKNIGKHIKSKKATCNEVKALKTTVNGHGKDLDMVRSIQELLKITSQKFQRTTVILNHDDLASKILTKAFTAYTNISRKYMGSIHKYLKIFVNTGCFTKCQSNAPKLLTYLQWKNI